MEEILHQLVSSLSHFYRVFNIPGGAGFLPSTVAFGETQYVPEDTPSAEGLTKKQWQVSRWERSAHLHVTSLPQNMFWIVGSGNRSLSK